jgi:hypothetical protein
MKYNKFLEKLREDEEREKIRKAAEALNNVHHSSSKRKLEVIGENRSPSKVANTHHQLILSLDVAGCLLEPPKASISSSLNHTPRNFNKSETTTTN